MPSNDATFLDGADFPDRPDHPDFWVLSKAVLANDAAVSEDGRSIPSVIGDVCDLGSIIYTAQHRIGLLTGQAPARVSPALVALYLDAFLLGARFQEGRHA